jgi:hypothetical protein
MYCCPSGHPKQLYTVPTMLWVFAQIHFMLYNCLSKNVKVA